MNNKNRTWFFEVHDTYNFPSDVIFTSPTYETKKLMDAAVDEYSLVNDAKNNSIQIRLCSKQI